MSVLLGQYLNIMILYIFSRFICLFYFSNGKNLVDAISIEQIHPQIKIDLHSPLI
jgi:hypothetical protein